MILDDKGQGAEEGEGEGEEESEANNGGGVYDGALVENIQNQVTIL